MKQSRFIVVSVTAVILLIVVVAILIVLLNPSISPITVFAATETPTPTASATFTATSTSTFTPEPPTATSTNTPTPTASYTPSPTLTPTPAIVTATLLPTLNVTSTRTLTPTITVVPRVVIQVVAQVAVFRFGPGTIYPVVSRLSRGSKIEPSGISEDKAWYMFKHNNEWNWISGNNTVTKVIEGDPLLLPVFVAPPIPTQGPTQVRSVDNLDWRNCVFNNNMSEEEQNNLVDQMHNSAHADDWGTAGRAARYLYLCGSQAAFYVVYAQVYQNKTATGAQIMEMNAALALFQQGWNGQ